MSSVQSPAVSNALVRVLLHGESVRAAALAERVNITTVRRALRRAGVPPRTHPSGEQHWAYVDGRRCKRAEEDAAGD